MQNAFSTHTLHPSSSRYISSLTGPGHIPVAGSRYAIDSDPTAIEIRETSVGSAGKSSSVRSEEDRGGLRASECVGAVHAWRSSWLRRQQDAKQLAALYVVVRLKLVKPDDQTTRITAEQ
ncbi:uncharacterized protein MYCFIDRAFT_196268 [Pseudocercospora fijiensis CIRAD86]|uniref:Uncharacterized protein n=1 Tax=Pseudocercospora fijiensis (strain CIRAD86) TaxID=383855 RepID=M2YYV8_PSEFD|nr:uncharacterized protein MYCFIDRAFT_196268 [Pseudocercospora fijiensis CIRAD86]EME82815.1 hypothetical protein MYCFIDRAFT_196268 [Pseudocercospora fijiensis CIRAD86]